MSHVNYYFSRYHFESIEGEKNSYLKKGLSTKAVVDINNFKYRFFDVEDAVFVDQLEDFKVLVGFLEKYDPFAKDEAVDEENEKKKIVPVKNRIVGKVRFIIYPEYSLIIFHEDRNVINRKTFKVVFEELFSKNHKSKDSTISLSNINQSYSFIEKVKEFTQIRRIVIELVPSNPNFADNWKDIDNGLRGDNITKYREVQENNKKNQSIRVNELTKQKFEMAVDGYGESTVVGNINGKPETISTSDKERQVRKKIPNYAQENQSILKYLIDTIRNVRERTKK
jgi:hypothetical protein